MSAAYATAPQHAPAEVQYCGASFVPAGPCPEIATVRLTTGCVHEHIRDGVACTECASAARNKTLYCARCYCGPDPHRCALIGREAPL